MRKPFAQCFWVYDGLLCAGQYPGSTEPVERDAKLRGLLACGIRQVVNLMEANEKNHHGHPFDPYERRFQELAAKQNVDVKCLRLPIRDASAPEPPVLREILDTLEAALRGETPTYVHCWGGHGRTSTVIACHLIEQGSSPQQAIDAVLRWREGMPKHHYPFEGNQEQFVRSWTGARTQS